MSDSLQYQQCRQLKNEGEQLLKAKQYAKAAQLYKQAFDLCKDSYAASRYIQCFCRTGDEAAREAAKFARQVAQLFPDNQYIRKEWAWALYYGYLKSTDGDDDKEDEYLDDLAPEQTTPPADFNTRVKAARNILRLTSDPFARKLAVFAICKEAKLQKKWELMFEFAQLLDPSTLSLEANEFNGRKNKSDYQRWLFAITRSSLELGQYDECQKYVRDAIEKFPGDSFYFHWWEAQANIRLGNIEEGLHQLEYLNMCFRKEWYIQRDIADAHMRTSQYDDAWLWFCRAASRQGDIKGRITMLKSMVDLLQRLEHWQVAYDHLLLIWAIEIEFGYKYIERTRQQIIEFRRHHADHILASTEAETSIPTISSAIRPCRVLWQKTIRQQGTITSIKGERGFGFITDGKDSFHFILDDFIAQVKPEIGMQVEFEPQDSFDKRQNKPGKIAVNIRPLRIAR